MTMRFGNFLSLATLCLVSIVIDTTGDTETTMSFVHEARHCVFRATRAIRNARDIVGTTDSSVTFVDANRGDTLVLTSASRIPAWARGAVTPLAWAMRVEQPTEQLLALVFEVSDSIGNTLVLKRMVDRSPAPVATKEFAHSRGTNSAEEESEYDTYDQPVPFEVDLSRQEVPDEEMQNDHDDDLHLLHDYESAMNHKAIATSAEDVRTDRASEATPPGGTEERGGVAVYEQSRPFWTDTSVHELPDEQAADDTDTYLPIQDDYASAMRRRVSRPVSQTSSDTSAVQSGTDPALSLDTELAVGGIGDD